MSETSGGQKNLHAGLKSVESAEHTQARRATEDQPLLVRRTLVFLALINTAASLRNEPHISTVQTAGTFVGRSVNYKLIAYNSPACRALLSAAE